MALNLLIKDLVEEINGLLILKAGRTLTLEEYEILESKPEETLSQTIKVMEKHECVDLLIMGEA